MIGFLLILVFSIVAICVLDNSKGCRVNPMPMKEDLANRPPHQNRTLKGE